MANTVTIKLVKGLAGVKKTQIAVVTSLGLRRTGDTTTQPLNEATKGKIKKVIHLIQVEER